MGARKTGLSLFLRLGRMSNLPTIFSNVLVGLALAGQANSPALLLLLPAVALFYLAGMFLNDAFDQDIDAIERPERPIPSGEISAAAVFGAGFSMMGIGLALLFPLGFAAVAIGFLLCGCIVFYNRHHKKNALAPLLMGLCRGLVYLLAASGFSGNMPATAFTAALLITAYVAGLTYTAKQENLLEFKNAWPLAIFAVPLVWVSVSANINSIPFLLLFLAWTGYALSRVLLRNSRNIRTAVLAMIAGISLLDAVLIAQAGQAEIALLAVAAFWLTLVLHRSIPGT